MIRGVLQDSGGNSEPVQKRLEIKHFFRENGSGVIASGSLGQTQIHGCNQTSLYFSCSLCSGGKHFSLKTK